MEPRNKDVVYNQDVVFREVKYIVTHEFLPKEPEKIEFEVKEDESNSTIEEDSEEEEPENPVVRRSVWEIRQPKRYIPSTFYSNFSLIITDDDPRTIRKAVDL